MQRADGVRFDIQCVGGQWFYRFERHRIGPFESRAEAASAAKRFLYCLYLRRLRTAALSRSAKSRVVNRPRRLSQY